MENPYKELQVTNDKITMTYGCLVWQGDSAIVNLFPDVNKEELEVAVEIAIDIEYSYYFSFQGVLPFNVINTHDINFCDIIIINILLYLIAQSTKEYRG